MASRQWVELKLAALIILTVVRLTGSEQQLYILFSI